MTYQGKPVRHLGELLSACCGWDAAVSRAVQAEGLSGAPTSTRLSKTILRPGEERNFLMMRRTEANSEVWDRLDRARFDVKFQACYCSVFEECWRSDLDSLQPKRVERCEAVTDAYR
jgi:hypothetical protein